MKRFLCLALLFPALAFASGWTVRPLAELALYPEFRAAAWIESLDESRIAAEVVGRIEALPGRVGERVAAGAELARIDPADYRIAADRAAAQVGLIESRLRLAEAQFEQSRALAARGFFSDDGVSIKETELAVLKSELEAARHALAAARLTLARTVIRAPFEGVISARLASVGNLASPGTPLLVLASTSGTEVHARVPTEQVDAMRAAGVWVLRLGENEHRLVLERVLPVVEQAGQTQLAVFSAPQPLAPGRAGEVLWRTVTPHLPPEYVVYKEGRLGAWVERDGQPAFVALTGASSGRTVPVDWPLATRVIDEGRLALGVPRAEATMGAEGAR